MKPPADAEKYCPQRTSASPLVKAQGAALLMVLAAYAPDDKHAVLHDFASDPTERNHAQP